MRIMGQSIWQERYLTAIAMSVRQHTLTSGRTAVQVAARIPMSLLPTDAVARMSVDSSQLQMRPALGGCNDQAFRPCESL